MIRRAILVLAVLSLFPTSASPAGTKATLDDGLLVLDWFPGAGEFRETDSFDYLWIKEGFTIGGRSIQVKSWEGPVWLDEGRDEKDHEKGDDLTVLMAPWIDKTLAKALDGRSKVLRDAGDLVLEGRFVDVNAGSRAAKFWVGFGAGSAAATWDMKLVDAATGELVVAIHHRAVSGTSLSDIEEKIDKWLEEFALAATRDFNEYAKGKKQRK